MFLLESEMDSLELLPQCEGNELEGKEIDVGRTVVRR